jgi:hypothetical protein
MGFIARIGAADAIVQFANESPDIGILIETAVALSSPGNAAAGTGIVAGGTGVEIARSA